MTDQEKRAQLSYHFIESLDSGNGFARLELSQEIQDTIDRDRKELRLNPEDNHKYYPPIETVGAMMRAVIEVTRRKQAAWLESQEEVQ